MQITPEAQARREAARTELGRFGHQQHSAPEVDARAHGSVSSGGSAASGDWMSV